MVMWYMYKIICDVSCLHSSWLRESGAGVAKLPAGGVTCWLVEILPTDGAPLPIQVHLQSALRGCCVEAITLIIHKTHLPFIWVIPQSLLACVI